MATFGRIIYTGFVSFGRNIWLSAATALVLTLSLSVVIGMLLFSVVVDGVILELESKVDISVYFKQEADEEKIEAVRVAVERFPEVIETRYTSREEALANFRARHDENDVIQAAIDELPENPLEASLAIRAVDASAYASIASFVEGRFSDVVSKVNYRENSAIIERVFSVTSAVRTSGIMLGLVLFFITGLVAFNTIRLAIFGMRDEIAVMRLVGASNWFIRGPFFVSGILNGFIGALFTFGILYGVVYLVREPVSRFIPGVDLLAYYESNWLILFGIALGLGIITTVFSSSIAIRRYLRV